MLGIGWDAGFVWVGGLAGLGFEACVGSRLNGVEVWI